MVRALKLIKKTHAAAFMSPEARARAARSGRAFLLGLVVACGIEVVVDSVTTLSDIAVLRDRVRQRGTSSAAVLSRALGDAVKAHDAKAAERLTAGVFDDPEVEFVRATDASGNIVYERIPDADQAAFAGTHGATLQAFYNHQLDRDARGIVTDPSGLAAHLAQSRHKDFAQKWSDFLTGVGQKLSGGEKRAATSGAVVLFQDRLYIENAKRDLDNSVTYAVARVEDANGTPTGAVIVAFDMSKTNSEVRGKYWKGAGMIAFFVGLIIVQHIVGRREKLRLLDLESREAAAREAILRALPKDRTEGSPRIAGSISPTPRGIDGIVWDYDVQGDSTEIVVLDPQGIGIDAAAVSLHVLAMMRGQRQSGVRESIEEALRRAGEAANEVPLTRALGVLILRIAKGRLEGISGPVGGVRIVRDGRVIQPATHNGVDAPSGVVAPLAKISCDLAHDDRIVIVADGLIGKGRVDVDGVVAHAATGKSAAETAAWARTQSPNLGTSDIAVATVFLG